MSNHSFRSSQKSIYLWRCTPVLAVSGHGCAPVLLWFRSGVAACRTHATHYLQLTRTHMGHPRDSCHLSICPVCSLLSYSHANTRTVPLVHLRTCLPTSRYFPTSFAAWTLHRRVVRLGNTARAAVWRFGPQPGGEVSQSTILMGERRPRGQELEQRAMAHELVANASWCACFMLL